MFTRSFSGDGCEAPLYVVVQGKPLPCLCSQPHCQHDDRQYEYGRQRNESPGIAVFHERFIDAEPAGDECAYACDRNAREQEYLHAEQKYAEYDENDYQCHDVFCLKYPD